MTDVKAKGDPAESPHILQGSRGPEYKVPQQEMQYYVQPWKYPSCWENIMPVTVSLCSIGYQIQISNQLYVPLKAPGLLRK